MLLCHFFLSKPRYYVAFLCLTVKQYDRFHAIVLIVFKKIKQRCNFSFWKGFCLFYFYHLYFKCTFSDYIIRQTNTINEAPVCRYLSLCVSPVALLGFSVCLICPRGKWTHFHVDSHGYTQSRDHLRAHTTGTPQTCPLLEITAD